MKFVEFPPRDKMLGIAVIAVGAVILLSVFNVLTPVTQVVDRAVSLVTVPIRTALGWDNRTPAA